MWSVASYANGLHPTRRYSEWVIHSFTTVDEQFHDIWRCMMPSRFLKLNHTCTIWIPWMYPFHEMTWLRQQTALETCPLLFLSLQTYFLWKYGAEFCRACSKILINGRQHFKKQKTFDIQLFLLTICIAVFTGLSSEPWIILLSILQYRDTVKKNLLSSTL